MDGLESGIVELRNGVHLLANEGVEKPWFSGFNLQYVIAFLMVKRLQFGVFLQPQLNVWHNRRYAASSRSVQVGPHGAKAHLVTFRRAMTESARPETLSLMFAVIL